MKVEQISIFIENKSGRLAEVTNVLGERGVNIRALSLADTSDFGILRLIVDKTDLAKETLKQTGFTVIRQKWWLSKCRINPGDSHASSEFWTTLPSMWSTCTPFLKGPRGMP